MSRDQMRIIPIVLVLGLPLIGFILERGDYQYDDYRGWLFLPIVFFQMGGMAVVFFLAALEIAMAIRGSEKRIGKYWIFVSAFFVIITLLALAFGRDPSRSAIEEMIYHLDPVFWWPERMALSLGMPWHTFAESRNSWIALAHVVVYWQLVSLGIVTLGYLLFHIIKKTRKSRMEQR